MPEAKNLIIREVIVDFDGDIKTDENGVEGVTCEQTEIIGYVHSIYGSGNIVVEYDDEIHFDGYNMRAVGQVNQVNPTTYRAYILDMGNGYCTNGFTVAQEINRINRILNKIFNRIHGARV